MARHTHNSVYGYFTHGEVLKKSKCKSCVSTLTGKHGKNLKRHLSNHIELYQEMQLKNVEKKKSAATKKMSILEGHEKLFQLNPDIKVKIGMKTIINAYVELVTVNGRPYTMLNDTGLRKIIDPVLKGINKKKCINSNSIKKYVCEESISIKRKHKCRSSNKSQTCFFET
ncbi:uncharacterized protein LOC115033010 [Acyrthosiphon pisum]|uniref:BED-type domain-containing protein n=1 Tax=Acyrthosiphon pisum TaxID=7029 RepID=A0A8R2D7U1_ACYPI|nr:uncharacterized protein LOC115033010 [Acyrthosiphon pisum]